MGRRRGVGGWGLSLFLQAPVNSSLSYCALLRSYQSSAIKGWRVSALSSDDSNICFASGPLACGKEREREIWRNGEREGKRKGGWRMGKCFPPPPCPPYLPMPLSTCLALPRWYWCYYYLRPESLSKFMTPRWHHLIFCHIIHQCWIDIWWSKSG